MRIKLVNFRCHLDAEYQIPDQGLVLLSGPSGSGKSSLLKAILYALFGKVPKPYSFGTTSCSVTLEFMGMTIRRSNRPKRLVVNGDLEDAAAQAFIEEKLGVGSEDFMISSYIPQKTNSSILSLPQSEQIKIIQTLTLAQNTEQYRSKLKEMIKNSSEKLVEVRAKVDLSQKEHDSILGGMVEVDFPLRKKKSQSVEQCIADYHKRVKAFNRRIEKLLEQKASCSTRIQRHQQLMKELEQGLNRQEELNQQLCQAQSRNEKLAVVKKPPKEDLEMLKDQITFLELQATLIKQQAQFEQIRVAEKQEKEASLKKLQKSLWVEKSQRAAEKELSQYSQQLEILRQFLQIRDEFIKGLPEIKVRLEAMSFLEAVQVGCKELTKTQSKLEKQKVEYLKAKEQYELEQRISKCPKCKTRLCWREGCLVQAGPEQKVDAQDYPQLIKETESQLNKLIFKIRKYQICAERIQELGEIPNQNLESVKKQREDLVDYISKNKHRQTQIENLQKQLTGPMSAGLHSMHQTIDSCQQDLAKLGESLQDIPTGNIDTLKDTLRELELQYANYQQHQQEAKQLQTQIVRTTQELEKLTEKLAEIQQELEQIDPDTLHRELESVDKDIIQIREQHDRDEQVSEQLEQFLEYQEQADKLDDWAEKLDGYIKQVKRLERRHAALLTLKERYTHAEILALDTTIAAINDHTRYFIDSFFPEHQLAAQLEGSHRGKTFKINTIINYKGNEYDNVNQLSGGEFDRCTLASICGINSMLGCPLLILDESLSALDSDTNTEIINFLHGLAQEKLIIVCSHEAVRGIFDQIVDL